MIVTELVKDYIRNMIMYSILSSCCLHLLPAKKYEQLAEATIGLGYICMLLDYGKTWLMLWR